MMLISTWTLLIPFLVYLLYIWFKPWIRVIWVVLSLPGPPVAPVIDNVLQSRRNIGILEFLSTAYVKYGPIVKSWITIFPVIFVLEPKHVQIILGSSKLSEKSFFYGALKPFLGVGLITHNGETWKSHRKHIQPYFYGNMFEQSIPTFAKCAEQLIASLKDVDKIKFTSVFEPYVMNILYEAILGISSEDFAVKSLSPFVKTRNVALERFLKPWLLIDWIFKRSENSVDAQHQTLEQFVFKIVQSKDHGKRSATKWNLLQFLYEIAKSDTTFQVDDAVNETCTFMLVGQDSTKITLAFTLYYLAKHQDVQDKVIHELNQVVKEPGLVNVDILNEMKYLEQCIKESLRLSPPAPLISRRLLKDVKLDECVLPAGCNVLISPYATHRIPEYFADPEIFDPDRFSEENQDDRRNCAYIPFSSGPRNCIGSKFAMLSMKTILSTLVRNYKFSLEPNNEPLTPVWRIVLKAKGNIWLKLEPRNCKAI